MAHGDPRPRHARHASRILRFGGTGESKGRHADQTLAEDDERTTAYIKRVLCSGKAGRNDASRKAVEATPLEDLLPPLTSSNELDVQLYAIVAVIVNQFVNSWYSQITLDSGFVEEIVNIIAHCTRGIEQRLKHLDLEELLLDELPAVMRSHVDAVNVTFNACLNDRIGGDARAIFHSLRPSQALTPPADSPSRILEQQDNEIAWAQLLVSRILPLVLPPEDLQNPCLHVLVSEVFSQIIVYNAVCERASEPWVIWEGVTKLIKSLHLSHIEQPRIDDGNQSVDRLQHFGLLSSPEARRGVDPANIPRRRIDALSQGFWSMLNLLSMAWLLLRVVGRALMHASSIPARPFPRNDRKTPNKLSVTAVGVDGDPGLQRPPYDKPPIVRMRLWSCIATLTQLEHRMPWLFGLLTLLQWLSLNGPGEICRRDGAVDRLISSEIHARFLRADLLPRLLLVTRGALFPNYALAPARQPPTSAEALQLKRECADSIVHAIPPMIRTRYFATKNADLMRQDVERTLDLFSDPYINRHFIVSALELLAVRLFPELEASAQDD